jgi:hypothetical protein
MIKGADLKEGQFIVYQNAVFEVILNEFLGELVLDCPSGQDSINPEKEYFLSNVEDYIKSYENHGECYR